MLFKGFSFLSLSDWGDVLIYGVLLGLIVVWEFLFVLMFFFEKVNVLEPNLFVRVFEMFFLFFVFVLVLKRIWGVVGDNKE